MPGERTSISFPHLLRLLIELRFTLAWRRPGRVTATLPAAFGVFIAASLAWLASRLLNLSAQSSAPETWLPFSLALLLFLTGLFWVLWPILAAQVDEAYELQRYLAYPVRPTRLYLAHTLLGFFEPTALLFYPLVGAVLFSLWRLGELPTTLENVIGVVLLCVAYVAMNVAMGRALLNMMLSILASRRSAEWLTLGALSLLALALILPPIDASWLFARLGAFGALPQDLAFLERAAAAMGRTPAGLFTTGLGALILGHTHSALINAASMLGLGFVAWLLGLRALLRFHRGGGTFSARLTSQPWEKPSQRRQGGRPRRAPCGGIVWASMVKELRQLLRLPKVQLLFFVPLFLAILLKVVGGPQLLLYLWGTQWAATLSLVLGLYAFSVWAGSLLSNVFGYDGDGVILLLASSTGLRPALLGKNLAHALLLIAQQLLLNLFVFTLPGASLHGLLLPLSGLTMALFTLLGAGSLLSLLNPRRLDPTLRRRDRPVASSSATMLAFLGVVAVSTFGAQMVGNTTLGMLPLAGLGIYLVSHRVATRLYGPARERLFLQIRVR
ncbi:MAG: hypothetical protein JRH20_02560 [Deltaproteobacteria bacterium]|nr:hypothetical protein [Deltaproteobacteria bacterium]